jgi:hypothetical protein
MIFGSRMRAGGVSRPLNFVDLFILFFFLCENLFILFTKALALYGLNNQHHMMHASLLF